MACVTILPVGGSIISDKSINLLPSTLSDRFLEKIFRLVCADDLRLSLGLLVFAVSRLFIPNLEDLPESFLEGDTPTELLHL